MSATMFALALAACGTGTAQRDRDAERPLEAPVSGPSAYVILTAADMDRGWDLLETMDTELPPPQRARIQARGLVSGGSRSMMIRFAGDCTADGGFVAAVRTVAKHHDAATVRCTATLPEN